MPDLPDQAGINYFPDPSQSNTSQATGTIDPSFSSLTRLGDPNSPAVLSGFNADLLPTSPVTPLSSAYGGGPNGYISPTKRNPNAGIGGGKNPSSAPIRAPGTWNGTGVYVPPYSPPSGGTGTGGTGTGGTGTGTGGGPTSGNGIVYAPLSGHYVVWQSDPSIPNARLFSPVYDGNSPPSNTNLMWMDTSTTPGNLKYYNGQFWVTTSIPGPVGPPGQPGSDGVSAYFTYRYAWSVSGNYNINDVVTSGGSSFVCVANVSATTLAPLIDTAHWQILAAAGINGANGLNGSTGPPGPSTNPRGTWTTSTTYNNLDLVLYNGSTYIALQTSLSNPPPTLPSTSNAYWQLVALAGTNGVNGLPGLRWRGAWTSSLTYTVNDAVYYNGGSYIAIASSTGQSPSQPPGAADANWSVLSVPGMNGINGQPGLNWKNTWMSGVNYQVNDVVQYQGSAWISLISNNNALSPPSLPTQSNATWSLLAASVAGPTGTAGSVGLSSSQLTVTSGTLVKNASDTSQVASLGKSSMVKQISTDRPAWVRIYSSPLHQYNDSSRPMNQDPVSGSGLLLEIATSSGSLQIDLSPPVFCSNLNLQNPQNLSMTIVNLDTNTAPVNVSMVYTTLEGISPGSNFIQMPTTTILSDGGTTGSGNLSVDGPSAVFDGDTTTFYDQAANPSTGYVGIDLGSGNSQILARIRYYPRSSNPERMSGGVFQGSADGSSWITMYTIPSTPPVAWTDVRLTANNTAFRYYRYMTPPSGRCNVAEIQFYRTA